MQRFSIARSLRSALVGLTLTLALVAALGVSSLYSSRESYENTLVQSSDLATAAANLASAAITEQEVVRDARGAGATQYRRQAAAAYALAVSDAASLAHVDPISAQLVREEIAAERAGEIVRVQQLTAALQTRQQARQRAARDEARSHSRRALILVAVAGLLAVIAALALITALVRSMRRPLDALVDATRGLASGDLERRVEPAGPRELQDLGTAFNAMGRDLESAQQRIDAERRRLAVTVESLGDALIVTEPGSTKIATVNPRVAQLVPELTVGSSVDAGNSPLPQLQDALAGETIVDHGGRTLAVVAAPLGTEADGVVWTIRDTSERARLERAKSDFVATASHELRSPLTSIKGFVELLDRSPENMSDRQKEFIEIILRSTDRLVELVNDLLDVARIEADRVEISRRPIDVGEAVREVAELMGPRFREKDQQLGVYVAPMLPLALADAGRVRQIVANLLTNAHQYTEAGGRIHIGVEPDRAWVQITVEDSGLGMGEEQAQRVFERFYRGPNGTSSSPGTGLGLSIVKSLVDLHEGEIDVDSEPGRGTIFQVRLPAALPAAEPERRPDALRGRRVLVVDDEREIAELIADQLAPLEVELEIAHSGEEALSRLTADSYDAITLDILMPGMDGFDVLRQIRSNPELRATPIVFVSVFSGRRELAGEWVVSKPIDADELRDVLTAAISAGRSRVLVVGREELQPVLEPTLDELGIEHQWERTGAAAARVCGERRFEVALIDIGVRNPQAVLQALDLRGRRLRRAVILFSDGVTPAPPGITSLGMEVVPVDNAAAALLAALRGEPDSEPES
jgi:signal transduction histidine kinase/DNA-binding NarL/FixJ family response regulator/HAMP domain-containing protein